MANTSLATLEEVKERLRIPCDTHDQDAVIDAYREAVEENVLNLTGFTFKGGPKVDTLTDWQRGTARVLKLRPVLTLDNIQGRVLGTQATFNQLLGDVKDPYKGRILLVGYLNAFYDPRAGYGAAYGGGTWENWFKWREYSWPLVKVSYTVDPLGSETNPVPKALKVATIEWVALIMSRPPGSGPITGVTIEKVSETYGPPWNMIMGLLARFIRENVVMQT